MRRKYSWANCRGEGWDFQGNILIFSFSCSILQIFLLEKCLVPNPLLIIFLLNPRILWLEWCSCLHRTTAWRSHGCSGEKGLRAGCKLNFVLLTLIIFKIGFVSSKCQKLRLIVEQLTAMLILANGKLLIMTRNKCYISLLQRLTLEPELVKLLRIRMRVSGFLGKKVILAKWVDENKLF